jgi:hypothetical protein
VGGDDEDAGGEDDASVEPLCGCEPPHDADTNASDANAAEKKR